MNKRSKRRSRTLDKAQARMGAMRSISTELDFGNGLTFATFEEAITLTREALVTYNAAIAAYVTARMAFTELERNLADLSERMLTGIATQYGKQSVEYEAAGGTRKGYRPRRRRNQTTDDDSSPTVIA